MVRRTPQSNGQQINRNIELIRHRRYGDELLLLELVNATAGQDVVVEEEEPSDKKQAKSKHKETRRACTFVIASRR